MTNASFVYLQDVSLNYPIIGRQKANINAAATGASRGTSTINAGANGQMSVNALQDIDLFLQPGDRLALVGRNGAGKTSLLKVMAGIYPPTTGAAHIQGSISTLFQMGLGMRPTATGYRNIELQCMIAGLTKTQIEDVKQDIIDFTELGDFLNLPVNTYSQGMAMRLNFAIATAARPDILIMDEWLGAGDASFRAKAAERMNKTFESAGIAVLASHNKDLLNKTCNLALWLDSGRQMAFGPLSKVLTEMDKYYES